MINDTPYPNRLGECMKAAGMTDPQLASLAGTTKQQIFKLRRGERNLTVQWAQRLAPFIGVEWYELVEGNHPPNDRTRADLFAAIDAMSEEQRQAVLMMIKAMMPPKPTNDPAPHPRRHRAA